MQQGWVFGLAGGLLIGLGGAVYLLGNGRIMGASGTIGGPSFLAAILTGMWTAPAIGTHLDSAARAT